jgi:hypothetical protein
MNDYAAVFLASMIVLLSLLVTYLFTLLKAMKLSKKI